MLRQFIRDSVIYGSSGALTRGISLLLVPLYTRVFTPNDYGIVDLLGIVGSVVASIVPLEVTQAIARLYPDCKDESNARELTSTAFIFTAVMFALFLLGSLGFAGPMANVIGGGKLDSTVFRVSCLAMAATGLFYFAQNQLRWMLLPKRHAVASLLFSCVTLGCTVLFVLVFRSGVVGVFAAQIVGAVTGFLVAFAFGRRSYALRFRVKRLEELLQFSVPLIPSSVGILALGYADRITITSYMTLTDLGIFGIGYRLASGVNVLMMGFQSAITPLVYYRYSDADAAIQLARVFRNFVFFALLTAVFLSMFAKEILVALTRPAYYGAAVVVPFLVASTFLSGMHVFAPGLGIAKKTRWIAAINIAGALLNVLLNVILVPRFGIVGAAVSTLASSTVIFAAFMSFSQRWYRVPHDFTRLTAGLFLTVVLGTIGFNVGSPDIVNSVLIKGGVFVLCIACLLALGIVRPKELKYYASRVFPGIT